ncbi:hypothetical protein KPH14_006751 [Odynerus spinipes]|uniref:SRR1-like domain-containing protein n=1 Tax=Odynerus spinipes TaxID=1348599 RepID=A0AAD9RRN1_9HYME|nr:hypothetical protein KPH14_006751 [Odynerus spinipes]
MSDNGFILVNRRRKRGRNFEQAFSERLLLTEFNEIDIDKEVVVRKLFDAVTELRNSVFKTHIFYNLLKALQILNANKVFEIICYGLGRFSQCRSSKYQLAFLLLLKRHYNCQVYLYDPMFLKKEIEILKKLELDVIETNEEGKHTISDNITLVYMPHCPKHFSDIVEKSLEKHLTNSARYLLRIYPYMTEIKLQNVFEHMEVFFSTSIHVFTRQSLSIIPSDFWVDKEEPCYQGKDIEFVTADLTKLLLTVPSNII